MYPDDVCTQLNDLAKQYSTADRRQRRKLLIQLLGLLQKADHLWRGDGVDADAYASAYQIVMLQLPRRLETNAFINLNFVIWFNQQLVSEVVSRSEKVWRGSSTEANLYREARQIATEELLKKFEHYDATKGTVINWYNNLLKWRVLDLHNRDSRNGARTISIDDNGDGAKPLAQLKDDSQQPEECARGKELIDHICEWIDQIRPQLEKCCLRDRADINCFTLILKRLPQEVEGSFGQFTDSPSWQDIAAELEAPARNLRRCFNQRCLPLLKNRFPIEQYV